MKAVVLSSNFSAAYLNYRFVENLSLTLHIRRLSVLCLLLANMSAKVILLRNLVPVFDRLLGGHRYRFVCSEHNETIKALLEVGLTDKLEVHLIFTHALLVVAMLTRAHFGRLDGSSTTHDVGVDWVCTEHLDRCHLSFQWWNLLSALVDYLLDFALW